MKVAVIMLGNNRHKSNDFGYWAIYAALIKKGYNVELLRININQNEQSQLIKKIEIYQVVFLSVYYDNLALFKKIIKQIRIAKPEIVLATGGSIYAYQGYPNLYDQDLILNDSHTVDFLIVGDPYLAGVHIVEYALNKREVSAVENVVYLKDGKKVYGKFRELDINEYDNVVINQAIHYADRPQKKIYITGSIGCTSNCSFCFNHSLYGKKIHLRTVDSIVEELSACEKMGHSNFMFIDSSLDEPNHDKQRLNEMADLIIKNKLNIYFTANMTCTAHIHDEVTLKRMHEAGLCCVFLGCEAFNTQDLLVLQKRHRIDDCYKTYSKCEAAEIDVLFGVINYNPFTSILGLLENDDAFNRLNLSGSFPYIRKLRVFPGTQIYQRMVSNGLQYENFNNYEFSNVYLSEIDEVLGAFNDPECIRNIENINYFYRGFIELSSFKKLYYLRDGNLKGIKQIQDIRKERDKICQKYGDLYSEWFRTLINDVQNKKNIQTREYVKQANLEFEHQITELISVKEELINIHNLY